MAKILSKSGESLADVYDVKGSIAGVDELLSEEVHLTHEMGGAIFAERLVGQVVVITSGAISQSSAFNSVFTFAPTPGRVLAIRVASTSVTRVQDCVVSLVGPVGGTEIPLFMWVTADGSQTQRFSISGGVVNRPIMTPSVPVMIPNLLTGTDASGTGPFGLFLRGNTTAFGAGTTTIDAMVYVAFPELGGVSSKGLPLPSW